jgi:hypothetical protein
VYEYGAVPPEVVAVNVTELPTEGELGLNVKPTASARGVMVRECCAEAVLPAESVPVRVTVYVPLTE